VVVLGVATLLLGADEAWLVCVDSRVSVSAVTGSGASDS